MQDTYYFNNEITRSASQSRVQRDEKVSVPPVLTFTFGFDGIPPRVCEQVHAFSMPSLAS
jgi:hypothetical protein